MSFSAQAARDGMGNFDRNRLSAGPGIGVEYGEDGQLLSALPSRNAPREAWNTITRWNGERKRWEVQTEPGTVNGLDPVVTAEGLVPVDPNFEISDLASRGGSITESQLAAGMATELVAASVGIADGVWMPIFDFRHVDGKGEPILPFFQQLGVRAENRDEQQADDNGIRLLSRFDPDAGKPNRVLMACDIYLAQARHTFQGTVDITTIPGASGQVADYNVVYDTRTLDLRGSRARLMSAASFPEPHIPTPVERLQGLFDDEGEDRLPICTVFLVSPLTDHGTEQQLAAKGPDGTWSPWVQHHEFWNFNHAERNDPPVRSTPPIRLFTGLGLGLGDIIGNMILAPLNDISQRVQNAINNSASEGKFWNV